MSLLIKIILFLFVSLNSFANEVNFHAWGGSSNINKYISNFGKDIKEKFGIQFNHIKIEDTQTSVNLIISEGVQQKSKVDLIWINGENFQKLKLNNLLYGPINDLNNLKFINLEDETLINDFGIPTDNYEIPWGRSQFVFLYDKELIESPPKDIFELKKFIIMNPGRFTYPKLPNFHGTTFLKQILYELGHYNLMTKKFNSENDDHKNAIKELLNFVNEINPYLWSEGKRYPKNNMEMMKMLANREIFISLSFNPNEASAQIINGNLRENTGTFIFNNGTIANTHYLAIPKYSNNIEGSLIVINELLNPKYQALKMNPYIWGDPTVLDLKKLNKDQLSLFKFDYQNNNLDYNVKKMLEPHISWTEVIEKYWIENFN